MIDLFFDIESVGEETGKKNMCKLQFIMMELQNILVLQLSQKTFTTNNCLSIITLSSERDNNSISSLTICLTRAAFFMKETYIELNRIRFILYHKK